MRFSANSVNYTRRPACSEKFRSGIPDQYKHLTRKFSNLPLSTAAEAQRKEVVQFSRVHREHDTRLSPMWKNKSGIFLRHAEFN